MNETTNEGVRIMKLEAGDIYTDHRNRRWLILEIGTGGEAVASRVMGKEGRVSKARYGLGSAEAIVRNAGDRITKGAK